MDKLFALCVFISVLLLVIAIVVANQQRRQHFISLITLENLRKKVVKKKRKGYFENLESKAKQAGFFLGGIELFVVTLVCCAVIFTLGLMLFTKPLAAIMVSFLGFYIPEKYLDFVINRRAGIMLEQMEKWLPNMANLLRAGYSLQQALVISGGKVPDQLGDVFSNVKKEMDAGVSVVKALENAAEAVPLTEFQLVVLATKIISQTGGNLPDIYETISKTIADRREMSEQQKAYTTEGRISASIVGGTAFAMIGIFRIISPDYFTPLLESFLGQIFFAVCIATMIFGWFAVRKISEPKF